MGYSTYNNNGTTSSTPSSCRVIYGRVEAYTTKRAGSDKKTAFEVGERYAHEMERLNEAVEALKRRHALEHGNQQKEEEEEVLLIILKRKVRGIIIRRKNVGGHGLDH